MNLWILKPGHKIKTREGVDAEVLSEIEDGERIRVRYLADQDDSLVARTEDLARWEEVEDLLGVAHKGVWDDRVTVTVHHMPESEELDKGYEAVTVRGVSHGVVVTGSDPNSAESVLKHLLDGLKAFGFQGFVAVEDAAHTGGVQRYEIRADR